METTLDGIRDLKLYQNKNGYRFSVDPLLLYSFVNVKYAKHVADLGTGSGVIGLLIAKKYQKAQVTLVELQSSLFRLAVKNTALNGLEDRVNVLNADIRDMRAALGAESCDLVVSNPPFRKPVSGRISDGEERAIARHELKLKLPELVDAASYLLKGKGRFFMIFHPERMLEIFDSLRAKRLEPKRVRFVYNSIDAVSKIIMVEAVKDGSAGLKTERPLFIYNTDGSYTDELKDMYGHDRQKQPIGMV